MTLLLPLSVAAADKARQGCLNTVSAALLSDLNEYLKAPSAVKTSNLALRLCRASPEGKSPCPITISQDRVADFVAASENNPGIAPVLACAAIMAGPGVAEEINELQAKLLDLHGAKFLRAWQTLPREAKAVVPKFEDFALLVPEASDVYEKKISAFESRIRILEQAPPAMKSDVAEALATMKETVSEFKKERQAGEDTLFFNSSRFFTVMADKMIRLKSGDGHRAMVLANQTLREQGLNYKIRPKSAGDKTWNVCSSALPACKATSVTFNEGDDSCGPFGLFAVFQQSAALWTLTAAGNRYRIVATEVLTPEAVVLNRGEEIMRFWNVPVGFIPKYLTPDLRTLILKTEVKSEMGRSLMPLHLQVQDNGTVSFIHLNGQEKFLEISSESIQSIKGLDGFPLKLHTPKFCK